MYRTHTCGELRIADIDKSVTLSGWVQRVRNLGGMTFIDLRDRYGITQLVFNSETEDKLSEAVRNLGREYVVQVTGKVAERSSKNSKIPTGDIEVIADGLKVLNASDLPPFTIEDETDGGEELRMKYRYLDLRRNPARKALELRHKMALEIRNYMDKEGFMEVETPVLMKSTPEGARDFVVPSRMNPGQFYALPQSPQVFKQLLMVAGYDRYFQIVKCFRDEDLRADRQPEFTQIDCEMSFVDQEDVLNTFEGMTKHLFKSLRGVDMEGDFPRMPYSEAMKYYGSDKPDIRFGMRFVDLTSTASGKGFKVFDDAQYIGAICAQGCASYSRKDLDQLTDFVKRPQVGAQGLVYVKYNEDGSFKTSVDKFFSADDFKAWADMCGAKPGDLLLILAGKEEKTLSALCDLRLEMGSRLGLRNKNKFSPLWVVDFPLLEWDDETERYYAMHHPFTSPKEEDVELIDTTPGEVRANAYDLVINGVEIGGGSIRIHNDELQQKMFKILGFSEEEAENQFGFLMNAFKYGAPPHGGVAFGFDRWVSLFAGLDSIREVIAFPKNNAGRDVMNDAPSAISDAQLNELMIELKGEAAKKTREE
ncbi:aspartate--tRNA ligase [Marinilabilia salmonicolor]|uniref:aspartate--tRNA ligase n=1 Tax=Marinilabilia salmonicolor TaxID=989 RepID=UPI0003196A32|nr:aspartate--tRNA ligase [Marinilabilia salmonicolor]